MCNDARLASCDIILPPYKNQSGVEVFLQSSKHLTDRLSEFMASLRFNLHPYFL